VPSGVAQPLFPDSIQSLYFQLDEDDTLEHCIDQLYLLDLTDHIFEVRKQRLFGLLCLIVNSATGFKSGGVFDVPQVLVLYTCLLEAYQGPIQVKFSLSENNS